MEVIGAVSAVVALTEATGKLAKVLKDLASRWSNAPEEIQALSDTAGQLAIKFAFVQDTIADSHNALLDNIIRQGLMQLVTEAKAATEELETLQKKLEEHGSAFQRTRWAVKDARIAKRISNTIETIDQGLSKWINYISLKGHTSTLRQNDEHHRMVMVEFGEVKQMLSAVTINFSGPGPSRSPSSLQSQATIQSDIPQPARGNVPTTGIRRVRNGDPWKVGERGRYWGLQGTVIKSTHGQNTDYDVVFNIPLPLAWLFGSHALRGQLGFRAPLRRNTLTLRHPSYFTVSRIVDNFHPFMVACQDGDLDTIRAMLRNGDGRPTDRTTDGESPMSLAIQSGSISVVTELLENGVDIDDGTVDSRQSTALEAATRNGQIGIIRHLLSHGASQDHTDLRGWGPSMMCWFRWSHSRISGVDLFNVLSEYALQDRFIDMDGFGYLHAAAVVSGAKEIHYLIRLGLATTDVSWAGPSPLHYAVGAGNLATYFALLSNHAIANGIGNHAYPLLHAAITGKWHWGQYLNGVVGLMNQETIIRDLLHRGIDPGTTNAPGRTGRDVDFPESVKGLSITAQQLAAAYDPEVEAWYMSILRGCGFFDNEEDISRLRYLESQGYVSGGHVIGEEGLASENDSDQESVHCEKASQDDGSEVEEGDCFWDAEEGV